MPQSHGVRILYIEDDLGAARLFQKTLNRAGYAVDLAYSGEDGLAFWDSRIHHILAVDHDLPGIKGLEAIKSLAAIGPLPPTIMITGAGNETVAVEAMKLGVDDYVIKDTQALYLKLIPSVIERALAKRELVHERRVAAEELTQSEERFRRIFEDGPLGMAIADLGEARIIEANYRLCDMLGRTRDELVGMRVEDFTVPQDYQAELVAYAATLPDEKPLMRLEKRYIKKDGSIVWGDLTACVMRDPNGTPVYALGMVEDITERKRAELQRQEDLRFLQTLLDAIPHPLFYKSVDRVYRGCNDAYAKFLDRPREEIVGKTVYEIGPPDLADVYAAMDSELFEHPGRQEYETDFVTASGATRHGLVCKSTYPGLDGAVAGLLGIIVDISDRMRAEEALDFERKQLLSIFDSIDALVDVVDLQTYELIYLNKYGKRLFGSDAIGMKCYEVFRRAETPCGVCLGDTLVRASKPFVSEYHSAVTNRDFISTNTLIRWPDGRQVKLALDIDISERKRAESLLVQAERFKAVSELASGVAHNFNNLLQVVLGSAQLAQMNLEFGGIADMQDYLNQIVESSKLGLNTVRRLQGLAKLRGDLTSRNSRQIDLSDLVRQAVEITKPFWRHNPQRAGVSISLKPSLSEGCHVLGIESDLFEVLVNLIKNAAEALPRGGEIEIRTASIEDRVVLSVADSGVGLAADEIDKVFDPFWTTKGVEGTGVGLWVTRGMIGNHGGTIAVSSEGHGKGATFVVDLPLAEGAVAAAEEAPARDFDLKLTVLTIDDVEAVVAMVRKGMERYGHTVLTALSGPAGLDLFAAHPVDVVICDLGMPEMSGWQVASTIKEICRVRGVVRPPFILLTGWGGQLDEQQKIAETGVDVIVEKPADILKLLQVIRELIEERRKERST